MNRTNRIDVNECAQFIQTHDNFLLITHRRPDGDTLGSAGALCLALRSIGKTAFLIKNSETIDKYAEYVADLEADENYKPDTIVSVDMAAETMFPKNFEAETIHLCIDHHVSNTFYAEKVLLNENKAACGELVFEVCEAIGAKIDKRCAELLYIAITTDTGCFQYLNTSPDTLRTAARLMEIGADCGTIVSTFFRKISRARMKLEAMIYESIRSYKDGEINIVIISKAMIEAAEAGENDCDDLAGIAGRVEGSKCSVTIKEVDENSCKVSVRSGKDVNAGEVCAKFGGGGHPMAAGCFMKYSTEKSRELLVEAILEAWN